uniref:Uncharacterized protein n=1 Tax=Fagus sylvatica TaxID=28930 RepID=A0A2N9IXG5_FAGSY
MKRRGFAGWKRGGCRRGAQNHVNLVALSQVDSARLVCVDWGEERQRVIEWDRPLVKVGESLRL